jgi:hypothetical protein
MSEQEQTKSDFKPEWKVDMAFGHTDDPVVVQVWKSNHRTPHYRISVVFKGRDGKIVPSLAIFSDSGVVLTSNPQVQVSVRFGQAFDHAVKEIESNEAAWQAAHPRRDQGGESRPGLKALSKMDKVDWESRGRPERNQRPRKRA